MYQRQRHTPVFSFAPSLSPDGLAAGGAFGAAALSGLIGADSYSRHAFTKPTTLSQRIPEIAPQAKEKALPALRAPGAIHPALGDSAPQPLPPSAIHRQWTQPAFRNPENRKGKARERGPGPTMAKWEESGRWGGSCVWCKGFPVFTPEKRGKPRTSGARTPKGQVTVKRAGHTF